MTTSDTSAGRLGVALFYGILLLLAWLVYLIFRPLLAPLAWACILVVVFHPLQERLEQRLGRQWAAALNTLLITLILVVPSILLASAFIRQGLNEASSAQRVLSGGNYGWATKGWVWVQQRVPSLGNTDLPTLVHEQGEKIVDAVGLELGTLLRNVINFFFDLLVMLLAVFYILRDTGGLMSTLRGLLPFTQPQKERMILEADELVHASVIFTLLSAGVHGLVGGVAFAVAGIPEPIFWGVCMAFFSIIPVVGSSIIWAPAILVLMARGHYGMAILVLVTCAGTAGLFEYIVRPWLISGRAQLSALVVFISVLGGLAVFGLLGVVLGPIIVATATSVLDIYRTGNDPPADSIHSPPSAVLQ